MCDKYVGRFTNFFALFYKFKYVQMVYVNNTSTNVFGLPVVAKVLSWIQQNGHGNMLRV